MFQGMVALANNIRLRVITGQRNKALEDAAAASELCVMKLCSNSELQLHSQSTFGVFVEKTPARTFSDKSAASFSDCSSYQMS